MINGPMLFFLMFMVAVVFIAVSIFIWFLVMHILMGKSQMTKVLDVETGALLATSRWGNGTINGVFFNNSLKVLSYEKGYELRVIWIFGGARLWLPTVGMKVSLKQKSSFIRSQWIEIQSDTHEVLVKGRLSYVFEPFLDTDSALQTHKAP